MNMSSISVASTSSASRHLIRNHHQQQNVHHLYQISHATLPVLRSSSSVLLKPKHFITMELNAVENLQHGEQIISSSSDLFHSPVWSNWFLWVIAPTILSFFKNKWAPLLRIKREVDMAMDKVEIVAEVLEGVAVKVDKIAEECADNLPEGKFKDSLRMIEHAAEEAVKGADFVEDLIHKAEEMERKVEEFIMDQPARASIEQDNNVVS